MSPELAAKLRPLRIRSTGRFLEAARSPKGRRLLAEKTGIPESDLLEMANAADRMRVPGLGHEYAELVRAAGVRTVKELKGRTPANLAAKMAAANKGKKLVGILPSQNKVNRWIEAAKKLPPKITYR
jgi:hypothetical protein